MKSNKKKFIGLLTCLSMFFTQTTVLAETEEIEYSILEDGSTGESVETLSELISQRTVALIDNDMERYNELDRLIHEGGVQTVTPQELARLTGSDPELYSNSEVKGRADIQFEVSYSKYKNEDVMRIYATPRNTENSYIYHSDSISVSVNGGNSSSLMDYTALLIEGAGDYASKLSVVILVTDIFEFLSSLSPNDYVGTFKPTGMYIVVENCSFICFKDSLTSTFRPYSVTSEVLTRVHMSWPELVVNGSFNEPNINSDEYGNRVTPDFFDNTSKAYMAYLDDETFYEYGLSDVMIECFGASVAWVFLTNPENPIQIGY